MARMLAESLSSVSTSAALPGPTIALAWLVFVTLVLTSALAIPILAWLLRRRLAERPESRSSLETVVFGISQKARRSPRHAVLLHRTVIMTGFVAVLSTLVLIGIAALERLGASGLQVAIGLTLPTLLVLLHARQRNPLR